VTAAFPLGVIVDRMKESAPAVISEA
jgi:hypothetical protein